MKTNLLFSKATAIIFFIATQVAFAQTGGVFGGTTPSIVNGTIIQFEDYDLGNNGDASVGGSAPFGYRDTTTGNGVSSGSSYVPNTTYRSGSDVDLATHVFANAPQNVNNGQITINNNTSNEFQYYTVTVGETSSDYFIRINYGHGSGTPKRFLIQRLNTDLTGAVTLVDGTDRDSEDYTALPKTANSYTLGTADAGPVNSGPSKFTLTAGETFVIKFTHKDGGPAFNWFQFINNEAALSLDDVASGANSLKVFPNPTTDGFYNLNIDTNWEIYSILGVKVFEGKGKQVDISSLAKGSYVLKTPNQSKLLISK